MINEQFLNSLGAFGSVFFLLLARFSTTFASISFFRRELLPARISLLLSIVLSTFVMLYDVIGQNIPHIPSGALFLSLAVQVALGLLTGFILNLFVDVFLALGQIISIQSGLGFVNLFVPRVGSITPLSQFFFITATLIFFELNGHLLLVKMIIESCRAQLLGVGHLDMDVLRQVMIYTKVIFSAALMLSLAVIIALLVANITLAIMTKFSPQLNIFSIGITISLITGFFMLYLCFDAISENGRILLNDILQFCGFVMKNLLIR
ncbi:flagellar biosynthetic protein FliR [Legionella sp. CNM-4043-24]|uniref:flagellar biosynthetic protein FliR n=1 Tax=Legionella sp. CNM-4043-24 TaxID=3421646 RepID=UPI00403AC218